MAKQLLLLITFVLLCSRVLSQDKNNDRYIQQISMYYGVDYNELKTHTVFIDSSFLTSIGLKFIYFYDNRDTDTDTLNHQRHAVTKYMGASMLIQNENTGNYYIYSKPLPPDYKKKDDTIIHAFGDGMLTFNRQYYCNKYNFKEPKDIYYAPNIGMSMKLSEILNDIPLGKKQLLTRTVIDSIIKCFIFYPNNFHPQNKFNIHLYDIDTNNNDVLFYINLSKSYILRDAMKNNKSYNKKIILDFIKFLKNNAYNNNFYLYIISSYYFSSSNIILVTVNESINTHIEDQNKSFYKFFDNEPMLYNIKIYDMTDIY